MSSERVRIEVAFDGGQVIAANIAVTDADDGHYTIALRQVVWIKRFARESRVGFGA